MTEQYTKIALPKGEWLDPLLKAFNISGLEPQQVNPRTYEVQLNKAIIGTLPRSKSVPMVVMDPESESNAGFTGSDITAECGFNGELWFTQINKLIPSLPMTVIYFGATPNLWTQKLDEGQQQNVWNEIDQLENGDVMEILTSLDITPQSLLELLSGQDSDQIIVTSSPNLSRNFLAENAIAYRRMLIEPGGLEGYWRNYPKNLTMSDVLSSGITAFKNGIARLKTIKSNIDIVGINAPWISGQDMLRWNDLQEMFYQALKRSIYGKS